MPTNASSPGRHQRSYRNKEEAGRGARYPEIDARIATQKTKLDELLRSYTEQHPDVVGTRRVIEELEEQRKQELAALQKAAAASPNARRAVDRAQPGVPADADVALRCGGERRIAQGAALGL